MRKTTKTQPNLNHRQALAHAVHEAGQDLALLTITKLVDLARNAGIIPEEIGANALWLAHSEWVRHAAGYHDPEEVPEFFNVKIEDTVPGEEDGEEEKIIMVQGYKFSETLNQEEWDQVLDTYKKGWKTKKKLYIKIVKLRNEYAVQNGWPLIPVPRG
jgi:hypothetical protein